MHTFFSVGSVSAASNGTTHWPELASEAEPRHSRPVTASHTASTLWTLLVQLMMKTHMAFKELRKESCMEADCIRYPFQVAVVPLSLHVMNAELKSHLKQSIKSIELDHKLGVLTVTPKVYHSSKPRPDNLLPAGGTEKMVLNPYAKVALRWNISLL